MSAADPHTLKLRPRDFAAYIATGHVPQGAMQKLRAAEDQVSLAQQDIGRSGVDASGDPDYEGESTRIIAGLDSYEQKVRQVTSAINLAAEAVAQHEQELSTEYAKAVTGLKAAIAAASNEAARAEVQTMMERLARMYFKQVAWLGESARYCQEQGQATQEAGLTQIAKAQQHSQAQAHSLEELQAAYSARSLAQVQSAEKAKIDAWLRGFGAQLQQQAQAASLQVQVPAQKFGS